LENWVDLIFMKVRPLSASWVYAGDKKSELSFHLLVRRSKGLPKREVILVPMGRQFATKSLSQK
jgi:hypothetical protein